jgi:hypothetical protein
MRFLLRYIWLSHLFLEEQERLLKKTRCSLATHTPKDNQQRSEPDKKSKAKTSIFLLHVGERLERVGSLLPFDGGFESQRICW